MSTARPETIASALRRAAGERALWLDVSGASMGRAIVPGSRVLVAGAPTAPTPQAGEIWAFCAVNGTLLVHRSRGRTRDGRWRFEGDANGYADAAVPSSHLIGRVVAVEHEGRVREVARRDRAVGRLRLVGRRGSRRLARLVRDPLRGTERAP